MHDKGPGFSSEIPKSIESSKNHRSFFDVAMLGYWTSKDRLREQLENHAQRCSIFVFFFAWRLEVQYFFTSFCKHRQGQNKPGVC